MSDKEKIKCYTASMGDGKLIDNDIKNIIETIKIELEENLAFDNPMTFDFEVVYLTQEEIDALPDFTEF